MHNRARQSIFSPLPHTGVRSFRPSFRRGLELAPEVFYPGPKSTIFQQKAEPLDPGLRRDAGENGNHWTPACAGVTKRTGTTKKTGVTKKTRATKKAGATRKISFYHSHTKEHVCFDRHSGESRNPEPFNLRPPYLIHLTPCAGFLKVYPSVLHRTPYVVLLEAPH